MINASLFLALRQSTVQINVLKKKNAFWNHVMSMSCTEILYRQLMVQYTELISEGEYEAACEEAAIDLGAHESDLDSSVEKELKIQSIKAHSKLCATLEQRWYKSERDWKREGWNPKSKKARNEKGVRILKQRAQADKHRR